jgi:hypothetical protein
VEGLTTQTSISLHLEKFGVFFKLVFLSFFYIICFVIVIQFFSCFFCSWTYIVFLFHSISLGYKQGFSKNLKFKVDHYGINDRCPNVNYYLDMVQAFKTQRLHCLKWTNACAHLPLTPKLFF